MSVYIFLYIFSSILIEVFCKEEYIPTLIWTSREFQGRKNVDYLVSKKIKNDLFESYIMEILGGRRPFVVVFLEQTLDVDDFKWRDKTEENSFPFLGSLSVNSRIDYFRSVEDPYETLSQLTRKGYNLKHMKPNIRFHVKDGDFMLVEFQKIDSSRPEALRNHDKIIKDVHQRLMEYGNPWICIYTARHSRNTLPDFVQLSPWHVDEQLQEKSAKALSIYRDDFTGFTLITKSSIQLLLPSAKSLVMRKMENYLGASAKSFKNEMEFVIWFLNYTLTFYLNQKKGEWNIKRIKLLNGHGDSLNLTPSHAHFLPKNKCYIQLTEFQNEGKPMVKVKLSKYKFLKLLIQEEYCSKPYRFQLTFLIICFSLFSVGLCWCKLLKNWRFFKKSKIVRIPSVDLIVNQNVTQSGV